MSVWAEAEPRREIKAFGSRKIIYVETPKKVIDRWARALSIGGLLVSGFVGYLGVELITENQRLNSQLIQARSEIAAAQNGDRVRMDNITGQVNNLRLEGELTSFGACLDRWGYLGRRPDQFNPEVCRAENQARLKLFREQIKK